MLNQVTLIGRVIEVSDDRGTPVVIVKVGSFNGRDELASARFYGDKVHPQVDNARPGALVKIDGRVSCRKGQKGGYFTGVEAWRLEVLEGGAKSAGTHRKESAATPPDDDDVCF